MKLNLVEFMFFRVFQLTFESFSPLWGKEAEAGLTRFRLPTTSPEEGWSNVCRLCDGRQGNGQAVPPGRTPRIPSASAISDWPTTTVLLNAVEAVANRE